MSLTTAEREELELLELLEAEAADPLTKSRNKQDLARVQAEADEILEEPSTGDKVASFAQGAADALSMGAAPVVKGLANVGGGALANPAAALSKMLAGGLAGEGEDWTKFREGYTDQLGKTAAAGEGKRGAAYGTGGLVGEGINIGLAGAGAGASMAKNAGSGIGGLGVESGALGKMPAAARQLMARLRGAGDELTRETLEGSATPTKLGALKRGAQALFGRGGEVKPSMVVEEASAAPGTPEWFASMMDDAVNRVGKVEPSGLELAPRPPPLPLDARPLSPIPEMPPSVMQGPVAAKPPAPMPADVMAGVAKVPPATAPAPPPSPVAPPPLTAAPSPAKPPPGVTFSDPTIDPHALADAPVWSAMDDMARRSFMQTVSKMPLAPAPQAAQPMTDAAIRAAVEQGVKQGLPLKIIAEQLGVPQRDIVQLVRGAQFHQPL